MRKVLFAIFLAACCLSITIVSSGAMSADTAVKHDILVILAEFDDVRFTNSTQSIDSLLDKSLEYFRGIYPSNHEFTYTVSPVITLPKSVEYYGANNPMGKDVRPGVLVWQACREAEKYIDFSKYDSSGDGYVDYVIIITAGGNESEDGIAEHLWPHKWDLYSANMESGEYDKLALRVDGKLIGNYSITSELKHDSSSYELCGIGGICHEIAHTLGLVDMYDTDYEQSGGLSDGIWGSTSLMDRGNFNDDSNTPPPFCAIELYMTGVGKRDTIAEGGFVLPPVETSQEYVYVPGGDPKEFYLIECRARSGRDRFVGGEGLLFHHIDMTDYPAGFSTSRNEVISAHQRWFDYNEVNCRPDFQCAELIAKNGKAASVEDNFWTEGQGPELAFRHSGKSRFSISDIRMLPDGSAAFVVKGPEISSLDVVSFQDAAIISWRCNDKGKCTITMDADTIVRDLSPYEGEKYSHTIEGLTPKTQYSVSISRSDDEKVSLKFTTKAYYSSSHPFIYLNDTPRNDDGSFPRGSAIPLRVNGAPYAKSVEWMFNGRQIKTGTDGYYKLSESGILKTVVTNDDGSTEIIIKEVTVK